MELIKCSGFVYEILTLLAWMTHTGSKKSCLSKRLAKMAQQGLVCEQGVFPYSGGESLTQAHTGGTAGTIRLCCLLVFGISSFSVPIPRVFLCLCGTVFAQGDSLIEYSNNVLQNVIRVP